MADIHIHHDHTVIPSYHHEGGHNVPTTPGNVIEKVWENGEDFQTSSKDDTKPTTHYIHHFDPATPVLPPPGEKPPEGPHSVKNTLHVNPITGQSHVTLKTITTVHSNGVQALSDFHSSATKLVNNNFSPNDPKGIELKDFLAAIHSAIDDLEKMLREMESSDATVNIKQDTGAAKENIDKGQRDQADLLARIKQYDPNYKPSSAGSSVSSQISSGMDLYMEKLVILPDKIALAKVLSLVAGGIFTGVGAIVEALGLLLAALVVALMPVLIAAGPIGWIVLAALAAFLVVVQIVAVVALALGIPQLVLSAQRGYGYMEGDSKLNELQGALDAANKDIQGAGIVQTKHVDETDAEQQILKMIKTLMKLLAKIISGAQLGTTDIQQMQQALSGMTDPTIPGELTSKIAVLEHETEQNKGSGLGLSAEESKKFEKYMKQAMKSLMIYDHQKDSGNMDEANKALDSLNQALYNIAGEAQNIFDPSMFANLAQYANNTDPNIVNKQPA